MNKKIVKVQEGFNVAQTYVFSLLPNTALMGNIRGLYYYSGNFYGINDRYIYKVTPGNTVGTVLLTATSQIFAFGINSEGYIYVSTMSAMYKSSLSLGGSLIFFIATTGTIQGIAFNSGNNMFIISNTTVSKINANTSIVTLKSNGIGLSSGAYLKLSGIAIDIQNNIYIVDRSKCTIYKLDSNGERIVQQIGSSTRTLRIDSTGIYAGFSDPSLISVDSTNNIYVVDKSYIRKIDTTFNVTSYTDTTLIGITSLEGVTTDPSNAVYCSKNGYIYTLKLACQAGYKLENNVCNICPKGTWSLAGATSCTACTPEGKTTPSTGATSSNDCSLVNAGYYMNGTTLTQCPANSSCPGGLSATTTSFSCMDGYQRSGTTCAACLAGSYGSNGTCTACPTNRTTTSLGSTNVSQCLASPGFFVTTANSTTATAGTACPSNTTTPSTGATSSNDCSLVNAGYYMNGTTVTQCPANTSCPGGPRTTTTAFTCANGYKTNAAGTACEQCAIGFYGIGGTCSNACPTNTTTSSTGNSNVSQCTIASAGYFMSGANALPCPSNARCEGGSNLFACDNKYMINEAGDGCMPCPEGKGGPICTEALPGYYLNEAGILGSCPSNATCSGGTGLYTCSNGYFVNYRNGTCDVVTTIVQPGSSQLLNTRGSPTIAETTACTPRECTILFKDPVTGDMLPRNPCISQGDYYNFATKKCINKCCLISLETAKNDTKCKTDVRSTPAVRKPGACPPRSANLCCKGNYVATNTSCRNFWTPGVDAWTAERNARCAAGFSDYGIDSISEKRRKYLALA